MPWWGEGDKQDLQRRGGAGRVGRARQAEVQSTTGGGGERPNKSFTKKGQERQAAKAAAQSTPWCPRKEAIGNASQRHRHSLQRVAWGSSQNY